eukprot:126563-Amphidinium_carterae.1
MGSFLLQSFEARHHRRELELDSPFSVLFPTSRVVRPLLADFANLKRRDWKWLHLRSDLVVVTFTMSKLCA